MCYIEEMMKQDLTLQEQVFRRKVVQAAIDNNRLEGMIVDDDVIALFNAWIENQITFDEVKRGVYEICGR
ncbi:antitoxin VbhA family protein [Muribacter muris]|nr:antitoxin VbhA family protein [Muribacter muris]